LGLVALAFVLVWFMDLRWEAARFQYAETFRWPMATWLGFLGVGLLAGLALGFALFLPPRLGRYRWGRVVVLGVVPSLLVVLGLALLPNLDQVFAPPHDDPIEGALTRLVDFFGGTFQALSAILVGVAVASGFAEPRPRRQRLPWPRAGQPPPAQPPAP
jgi:hypothetical protein